MLLFLRWLASHLEKLQNDPRVGVPVRLLVLLLLLVAESSLRNSGTVPMLVGVPVRLLLDCGGGSEIVSNAASGVPMLRSDAPLCCCTPLLHCSLFSEVALLFANDVLRRFSLMLPSDAALQSCTLMLLPSAAPLTLALLFGAVLWRC